MNEDWTEKHIFLIKEETEDENYGTFLPGWYFWDETYTPHGPFSTKEETHKLLLKYVEHL